MKRKIQRELAKRKKRIERRLASARRRCDTDQPVIARNRATYETGQRTKVTAFGGIAAVHQMCVKLGLTTRIDESLQILQQHRPYHESDHILSIAYNALCGGQTLADIERRRNDEAFLDLLGAVSIPDPTTAGDFCRRFTQPQVEALQDLVNETRLEVWSRHGLSWRDKTARVDVDGSIVETTGECKAGIGLSYNGIWGYHPLIVSLANTQEPMFIVNRSGNRNSAADAVTYLDKAIVACRKAGFADILLRGDTAFSHSVEALKRWDDEGVRFVFGYPGHKKLKNTADAIDAREYHELVRQAETTFEGRRRAPQPRIKPQIIRDRGYRNIRLRSEDLAEFEYTPARAGRSFRIVVLRKNLTIEKGEQALLDEIRYFFYITNDRNLSVENVVREANQRCNQESLIAELKSGVRALHAPSNTLIGNWAYMVMTALAWTLKAWMALLLPDDMRWNQRHAEDRRRWLRMTARTFCQTVIQIPAQVISKGRQRIVRVVAWTSELHTFFRLCEIL